MSLNWVSRPPLLQRRHVAPGTESPTELALRWKLLHFAAVRQNIGYVYVVIYFLCVYICLCFLEYLS
jgi:hypothetical protein